ncbi:hypothetical protein A9J41_02075 [Laribacter hongkongensis]|uniref:hypothetical protein n=1 Tax=Laribacter hongkongensis TaxID=168471 RepID=UPI0018789D41|nr:hypothetical protein [Laribacter hongkongensis]MBE5528539.1 hypothetical protein [Laribacter hongkongensis]
MVATECQAAVRLSAWMDEELPVDEACRLGCLDGDLPGLARSWDTWQIIGQALRQGGAPSGSRPEEDSSRLA